MKAKMMLPDQRYSLLVLVLALLGCAVPALASDEPQPANPKVILLGFDGIDPKLCEEFFKQGELPNLKQLAERGGFQPLQTMYPAQSPVCWASALSGKNPGKHGVMGFVRRRPGSYAPELGIVRLTTMQPFGGTWGRIGLMCAAALALGGLAYGGRRLLAKQPPASRRVGLMPVVIGLVSGAGVWFLLGWIPTSLPQPTNARQGAAFMDTLNDAGITVASLNTPMDWPVPQRANTLAYAGFNVPDLRGTFGVYSYYTTAFRTQTQSTSEMGGDEYRIEFKHPDVGTMPAANVLELAGAQATANDALTIARAPFRGPRDVTNVAGTTWLNSNIVIAKRGAIHALALEGCESDRAVELKAGQWTPWITATWQMNPLIRVAGRVKAYCESVSPALRLYLTPLQMHPLVPAGGHEISSPRAFLVQEDKQFEDGIDTLGWPELTHPVFDENMADSVFMEHLMTLERKRYAILKRTLARKDRQMVAAYFFGSDRVQHIMWRYRDSDNINYESLQASPERDAVLRIYQFMDEVVGDVLTNNCDPDTLLMVVSDHGFAPFNRAVSLNRWLRNEGYLVLKQDQDKRQATDMFDPNDRDALVREIDWSKTRAYALGLGKIHLNIKGREPQGCVEQTDVAALTLEIQTKLEALTDAERKGQRVVSRVLLRDELVHGPYAEEFADMLIGFFPGYRVSWQTTLGYAGEEVIFTNDRRWSADHCSIDSELLPGVIFSNRKLPHSQLSLMDLAPTIVSAFGLPLDADYDGKPIAFGK